jgi:hypothetical protein
MMGAARSSLWTGFSGAVLSAIIGAVVGPPLAMVGSWAVHPGHATASVTEELVPLGGVPARSKGSLTFLRWQANALSCDVKVSGLASNGAYVVRLEGVGLPDEIPGTSMRYVDVCVIVVDDFGGGGKKVWVPLGPGSYRVKVLLKEYHTGQAILENRLINFTVGP